MQIRIPHVTKVAEVQSLRNAIERACGRSGVDEYAATMWLTEFLEAVADETTKGRNVMIPGFGLISPVPCLGNPRHAVIRFSPARPYRQQVWWGAPPKTENAMRYRKHQQNHHPSSDPSRANERTFTAMEMIRESIRAQLGHARDE